MIKTMILASFMVAFTFIAIPVANACSKEGCSECSDCSKAKAYYDKKAKKAPCAKCAEAKAHYKKTGEKKPCKKCAEAKAHYKGKAKKSAMRKGTAAQNEKGSLTFKSGQPVNTGSTSPYNN